MDATFLILNLIASFVLVFLLAVQVYKLRKTDLEYRKSKSLISDVVLSFNKQLKNDEFRIEEISKVINSSVKGEKIFEDKLTQVESIVSDLRVGVEDYNKFKEVAGQELSSIKEEVKSLSEKVRLLERKVQSIEPKNSREAPEEPIESTISIKRERALSPLNDTELNVLRVLAVEGEKTALQIKERFKLSREHSSRLLKKLYESGYLERVTSNKPYLYGIKKEMRGILNNT